MDNLKTLHDRWVKNRSCIHFSVSIRLLDGKIQAELKDAPPQYRKALLSMMEMIMSNGVLYIKAAYHDAIRKKGLDMNEKKVHDDLDLRLVERSKRPPTFLLRDLNSTAWYLQRTDGKKQAIRNPSRKSE